MGFKIKSFDPKKALGKITDYDAGTGIFTIVIKKSAKKWPDSLMKEVMKKRRRIRFTCSKSKKSKSAN